MTIEPSFEVLEHTADAGIVARGPSLESAFEAAAAGMYSLMVDLDGVRELTTRQVEAEGEDPEHLLSDWLLELLMLTEIENLVFRRFEVRIDRERLTGSAFGEELDLSRHEVRGMVKGVTRHMLAVEREQEGYVARVIFDM